MNLPRLAPGPETSSGEVWKLLANNLSKTGRIHRLNPIDITEIDIVQVEDTAGNAHSLGQFVVVLQPHQCGRSRMWP